MWYYLTFLGGVLVGLIIGSLDVTAAKSDKK